MWRAVNGWAVGKVLLYVKEAIGVLGVAGMLNATKDQPANTEEQKPDSGLHRFSDLLFQQPTSSLVSMYFKKTSQEVSEQ